MEKVEEKKKRRANDGRSKSGRNTTLSIGQKNEPKKQKDGTNRTKRRR
jgi:hypothetical protein